MEDLVQKGGGAPASKLEGGHSGVRIWYHQEDEKPCAGSDICIGYGQGWKRGILRHREKVWNNCVESD